MDDQIANRNVQAENNSIAIGEINITGTVTGNISIGHTIVQAADAQLRHDLGILLKNVQTTWIKGVLERSVYEAALLDLGMEIREEAVDNPWRLVMEAPDETRQTLALGKTIKDIFHEANGLLLILGEPGSGKTTTLLQLARDLLTDVDQAFTQSVPVILNLSTWTNKEQPLDEWLIAELNNKYRVPKKDGRKWLEGRRILPLLDGLDEVRAENRTACVEKINQLVQGYGLQAVVCSRIKDYTVLGVRLGFYRAIYIQPLTPEQVDEYLEHAGERLASLRATLQADKALKEMAQSPLILNVMSLAYQNTSADALSVSAVSTNEARRWHLFDTYISRMFNRKAGSREYEVEKTKQRMSWLASKMQLHNQEIFFMEGLQPSWLSKSIWQWVYIFISRLISVLILIMVSGVFSPPLVSLELWPIVIGGRLLFGVLSGIFIGLVDCARFGLLHLAWVKRISSTIFWPVLNTILLLPSLMIIGVLIVYPMAVLKGEILTDPLSNDLGTYSLALGLLFGIRGASQHLGNDIQTAESLKWSWRKGIKGGIVTILIVFLTTVVLYIGIFLLLAVDGPSTNPNYSDQFFFFSLIVLGINQLGIFIPVGIVYSGLKREIVLTKSTPNQGIRLSMRNAAFSGLVAAIATGLISVPIFTLIGGPAPIIQRLVEMTWFGSIAFFWYGGLDVIQHYVLRLFLVFHDGMPPNYARFLDYAVDRIFLQKVGGGYRFIHRLLLEHFAEMSESPKTG